MMTKVTTSGRKSFDELYEEYSSMSIAEQLLTQPWRTLHNY